MSSSIGEKVRLTLFGQSHGTAIGAVLDGLPAGETIDLQQLAAFMTRRAARSALDTPRQEADRVELLSGLVNETTCGAPLAFLIENQQHRSGDYQSVAQFPRPSHADYTAQCKYGRAADLRGGGHLSGRMTAPLCAAGGICLQLLNRRGIFITGKVLSIEGETNPALFTGRVLAAQQDGDSVGGIVECIATGLPPGVGEPWFDGLESRLSQAIFSIPAVKGVEFGSGFLAATLRASQHNDPFILQEGRVLTEGNNHGGSLGGISSGMPLVLRVAFKPTPSIALEQKTVDLKRLQPAIRSIQGRHDPCVVFRAVPCVEAAVAVTLLDLLLLSGLEHPNSA